MIRITAHFSGRVQGVGFRFTTCNVARGFDVTGYVRNLHDGRVECAVEGDRGQVKRFLHDVQKAMGHHITETDAHESAATGEFSDFGVRY